MHDSIDFCQSRLKILPYTKWTLKQIVKDFKFSPKCLHFAKSGHTGYRDTFRREKTRHYVNFDGFNWTVEN